MGLRSQRHLLSKSENKWSQLPSVPPRINKSNGVSNILQKTELCDFLYAFFMFRGLLSSFGCPRLESQHPSHCFKNLVVRWDAKYCFQIESDIEKRFLSLKVK